MGDLNMGDDLVKRLRCYADLNDAVFHPWVYGEAADRIEKLEAALRTVKEWHGYGLPVETTRIIDAALEVKDDVD
jgi:hypothetical protein